MPKSQAAKELAAKQKAQAKAEKERRKHSDNPKDWGTGKQLVETFKLTRQVDPQLLWWVIGSFVAGVVVFTVLGLILTDLWWAWLIVGIFAGAAAAMWVFQWRAKRSMYARFKGQTGSAEVACLCSTRRSGPPPPRSRLPGSRMSFTALSVRAELSSSARGTETACVTCWPPKPSATSRSPTALR